MPPSEVPTKLSYECPRWVPAWAVPAVPVPESNTHDLAIEYLRSVLLAWAAREERAVMIARNLGIRWHRPERRAGFDPDLCVVEPPPPEAHTSSLRLWEEGHTPPLLAIEIVSPGHPYKDYVDTPERCAACGIGELWVYDPLLVGPRRSGGPHALQIWSRSDDTLTRTHCSNRPGYSPALHAWLHPSIVQQGDQGRQPNQPLTPFTTAAKLRLSNAEVGGSFWPTLQEHQQAELDDERAARQALERELAELRKG
jgi:Uma2 family endonuclease